MTTKLTKYHTGFKPGPPPPLKFSIDHPLGLVEVPLPDVIDNFTSPHNPLIYDQGPLGECVLNGVKRGAEWVRHIETGAFFDPSRLFGYYNGRVLSGEPVDQDTGITITAGVESMQKYGSCPESEWPNDVSRFAEKPPEQCYKDAPADLVLEQYSVQQTADELRKALAAGFLVVFGFRCMGPADENAPATVETLTRENPVLGMPAEGDVDRGGHCVTLGGWDAIKKEAKLANSWSDGFAEDGYFRMTEEFILSEYCSDFRVISKVAQVEVAPVTPPAPWWDLLNQWLQGLFGDHAKDGAIDRVHEKIVNFSSTPLKDEERREGLAGVIRNEIPGLRDSLVNLAVEACVALDGDKHLQPFKVTHSPEPGQKYTISTDPPSAEPAGLPAMNSKSGK